MYNYYYAPSPHTCLFSGIPSSHSTKSNWADSKKSSSFAAESEVSFELGNKKYEDTENIAEGGGQEMKVMISIVAERVESQKDILDMPVAVNNTSFILGDVTEGIINEAVKGKYEDTESEDKDGQYGLTSSATTLECRINGIEAVDSSTIEDN